MMDPSLFIANCTNKIQFFPPHGPSLGMSAHSQKGWGGMGRDPKTRLLLQSRPHLRRPLDPAPEGWKND